MIISYSMARFLVDRLQNPTARPLTEAEIEAGALAELQVPDHPGQRHNVRSWLHLIALHLPRRRAAAGDAH